MTGIQLPQTPFAVLARHGSPTIEVLTGRTLDVDLLADVVNRVWFLDAVRGEADVYNMGWQKYLDARATDEARRRREQERQAAPPGVRAMADMLATRQGIAPDR